MFDSDGTKVSGFYTDAQKEEFVHLRLMAEDLGVELSWKPLERRLSAITWYRVTLRCTRAERASGFEFAVRSIVSALMVKGYTVSPIRSGEELC